MQKPWNLSSHISLFHLSTRETEIRRKWNDLPRITCPAGFQVNVINHPSTWLLVQSCFVGVFFVCFYFVFFYQQQLFPPLTGVCRTIFLDEFTSIQRAKARWASPPTLAYFYRRGHQAHKAPPSSVPAESLAQGLEQGRVGAESVV